MWIEDTYRRLHLDFHMPDWSPEILARFDAGQIVESTLRARADALYFFAKCHYGNAYYRTEVGHRHRGMGERDFLAEVIEECRKAKLTVVAYFSLVWDQWASLQHPDWCMRDPEGNAVLQFWPYLCFNSPYREYTQSMLRELVKGYDIDGIHFDMINFPFNGLACYCDRCRRLFLEEHGLRIPERPTWDEPWRAFLRFRNETVSRFAGELQRVVREQKPGLEIDFNYHGSPGFDWRAGQRPVEHASFSAQSTGESYPAAFGVHYTTMEARFLKGLFPGRPAEIVTSRFGGLWDYTIKPEAQLRWELCTALANGCKAMVVDQNLLDGTVDPLVYERVGEVFGEIERKRELWGGEPLRFAGLYYSCSSRDFYARGDLPRYLLSFGGAFRALVESHLPVEILQEEGCTLQRLQAYPVVVLANVAAMGEAEAQMFRRYVSEGGVLVATGDTALYDQWGEPRRESALDDLFGASFEGWSQTRNVYLRLGGAAGPPEAGSRAGSAAQRTPAGVPASLAAAVDAREYIVCNFPAALLRPTTGTPHGSLHLSFHDSAPPYRTFSHHLPPPWKEAGPALVLNACGKGFSLYCPARLAAAYADLYNLPAQRRLLAAMVTAHARPPVQIAAPLNVEVVIDETQGKGGGRRWVIHLLGFNARKELLTRRSNMEEAPVRPGAAMEEAPLYRARIELPADPTSVRCWSKSTELKQEGRRLELLVSEVHEAVVVELPA
jgi:hypothetical protein